MLTRDLMTREIETCTLEDSAAQAIAIMTRRNCGFVPVVLDPFSNVLEGVVTDRDLALFLGRSGRRAGEVKIKECFTRDPKCVVEDTKLHDVARLMEDFHIHRVPVTDNNRRLLGIISLKDLAEEAWKERGTENPEVTEKEIGEIVESISRAR